MIRGTRQLLVAVLALAALDVGVAVVRYEPAPVVLPSAPAFDPALATSLHVTGPTEAVTLVRTASGWQLTAPTDAPADPMEVEALLAGLAGGIRPDLRIGDGDHETYGLSGGDELRVEVDGAAGRLSAIHVGHDAGGGATWIRLPDHDDVYQARIGGRARFDRPAGAWRDRRVTDLDPATVERLTVRTPDRTLSAVRGPDGWVGDPDPVDGPTVERVLGELAHLRASEVLPDESGIVWDGAEISLTTKDDTVTLTFGGDGPLRSVRRADRPDRWRIAATWVDRLADPAFFRDRAVWTLARVERFELRALGREGLMVRTPEGWRIQRPANVDVDPARADAVAAFLANPRVVRWDSEHRFTPDRSWIVTGDGVERRLEIGAIEADRAAIRADGRVGWIEARLVQGVEGLFGG